MAYTIDRPNIQLDAADCLAIKNNISSISGGYPCEGPNVQLDKTDLAALKVSRDAVTKVAVSTENLQLSAADVTAMASSIT